MYMFVRNWSLHDGQRFDRTKSFDSKQTLTSNNPNGILKVKAKIRAFQIEHERGNPMSSAEIANITMLTFIRQY